MAQSEESGSRDTRSLFGPQRTRSLVSKVESGKRSAGEEVRAHQAHTKGSKETRYTCSESGKGWRRLRGWEGLRQERRLRRGEGTPEPGGDRPSQGLCGFQLSVHNSITLEVSFSGSLASGCFLLNMAANSQWSPAPALCRLFSTPVCSIRSVPHSLHIDWTLGCGLGPLHGHLRPFPLDGRLVPPCLLQARPWPFHSHPSDLLLVPGTSLSSWKVLCPPRPLQGSYVPFRVLSGALSSLHKPASTSILHLIPSPACDLDGSCWCYSVHTRIDSFTACRPPWAPLSWLSRGRRPTCLGPPLHPSIAMCSWLSELGRPLIDC